MKTLKEIRQPVSNEMDAFEPRFRNAMKSNVALLDIITRYIVKRKGKQVRPLFVFLSAGATGAICESTYRAAILTELLHTATLIHDDVVDHSYFRRGMFSINALWGNKISVLVGDYLLATGLMVTLESNDFHLLKIATRAIKEMSQGELLQLEKARKLNIDEDIYFEIIRKKTASLIASCCATGTASSGASPEMVEKMWHFGELAGTAFQIKDDLFDFEASIDAGKPKGLDIRDRKMTLPLIHALHVSDASDRRYMTRIVKNHNTDTLQVNKLLKMVQERGGIEYARQKMTEIIESAFGVLGGLPDSPHNTSLRALLHFLIERKS
ncbi:MAG: polyprenyl synthetase family protein [Bacteroidetes bacterium]|nr:polyprenyl synthetase family protein [Bacteroidota bacterium]MBU1717807.1 polyprenyl synthetase family protein [Bacteroidota bacterium]